MAGRPPPAGPKTIRELFHYTWTWLNSLYTDSHDQGHELDSSLDHTNVVVVDKLPLDIIAWNEPYGRWENDRRTRVFFQLDQPGADDARMGDLWVSEVVE